jgi:hypothetical protein
MRCLTLPTLAFLSVISSAAAENIALGRPYVAYPRLGGHASTNNGKEAKKLTDGLRSGKVLWEDPEHTVGWMDARWPVQIVVDLGKRQPISGISLGCGAGVALSSKHVHIWPGTIDLYVSDDSKEWHRIAELTSLNDLDNEILPPLGNEYAYRNISTNRLRTAGRYVRIVLGTRKEVFLDEIEIHRGDDALLSWKPSKPGVTGDKIEKEIIRTDATLFVSKRRHRMDVATILSELKDLPEEKAAPIRKRLVALREKSQSDNDTPAEKRAILPQREVGREILAEQAAVWREKGVPPLTIWQTSDGRDPQWLETPPAENDPRFSVHLIRGEDRTTTFNITNASPREQILTLSIAGHGDTSHIRVRSVEWTETVARTAITHALPDAAKTEGGHRITIPSGMTRQVSLSVHGGGKEGNTAGVVRLTPEDTSIAPREIPLDIHLHPFDFPEKQALHFSGWDYLNKWDIPRYGVTPNVMRPFRELILDYKLDLPWGPITVWPKGKFSAEQSYASPADEPDTAMFDTWVKEIMPGMHSYKINISGRNKDNRAHIDGVHHDKDPEGFDKRVATWLRFWEKHVISLGLDPAKFSLLIIDEPGLDEAKPYKEDEAIRAWVEAVEKSGVKFRLWMDPVYHEPWNAYQPSIDAMDELCLKYSHLITHGPRYVDYYKNRSGKQQLSLYECYPIIGGFDPYSYWRLQAWMAWTMDADAIGFWCVADTGRNPSFGSWNNGLNTLHYCPLFLDAKEAVPGKALEAIREGIYDFQYLVMLRDAIQAAREKGVDQKKIDTAEKLLADAPQEVLWNNRALAEPKWLATTEIDRTIADQMRVKILETLGDLAVRK